MATIKEVIAAYEKEKASVDKAKAVAKEARVFNNISTDRLNAGSSRDRGAIMREISQFQDKWNKEWDRKWGTKEKEPLSMIDIVIKLEKEAAALEDKFNKSDIKINYDKVKKTQKQLLHLQGETDNLSKELIAAKKALAKAKPKDKEKAAAAVQTALDKLTAAQTRRNLAQKTLNELDAPSPKAITPGLRNMQEAEKPKTHKQISEEFGSKAQKGKPAKPH